jgi:ribosome-associated protein
VKLLNKINEIVINAIEEKKGTDITTIEFKDKGYVADAFIIATGNNDKQTKAIADFVEEEMEKNGETVMRREGYQLGKWIILDYGFLMVHIFTPQEREYYDIERLWQESKKLMGMEKDDVQ